MIIPNHYTTVNWVHKLLTSTIVLKKKERDQSGPGLPVSYMGKNRRSPKKYNRREMQLNMIATPPVVS